MQDRRVQVALGVWLVLLLGLGVGGLVAGEEELALLVALSGVVIAAQAADLDARWRLTYQLVSLAFITACAAVFLGLASYFRFSGPPPPMKGVLQIYSLLAAALLAATALPPVARAITRRIFRVDRTTHALRLAARLMLAGFLIPLPGWFLAQDVLSDPEGASRAFAQISRGGSLAGYVLLALASVAFLVRRDVHSTWERLGLGPIDARGLRWIAVGVPVLFGLNAGSEWLQHHWFPGLWAADHAMNAAIVGALDRRAMLIVGLSAGIGEEITLRGALQPRLGLVPTSLMFALLHVQYSWFGMATIFLFGLLLGFIRKRSNTTVVMAVHALYDTIALFTT